MFSGLDEDESRLLGPCFGVTGFEAVVKVEARWAHVKQIRAIGFSNN